MYRVMLIDDEPFARKLLLSSIKWSELNMEVVGEAGNGIEAINVIDEMKPDIAFVDISMPFMNGIDFAAIAAERYPNLAIIIMTALDEFEYARKCVHLHVFEYMLKPIVRADVTETLRRLKAHLDAAAPAKIAEVPQEMEPSTICQIEQYLQENFADSQINLTSVAQLFGFSPSYLSRKFKQDTGKSFVEYLTECRMERAREMAGNNSKMFCTATAVGIPDPNYFGRCFKKYTGTSYSEYVKMRNAEKK